MRRTSVAIVGCGPYGMSIAAHLSARQVDHVIFGQPMRFWSQIAAAGPGRYLKSFCFGTDLSTPRPGFRFADYNAPRGLETFEPCSIDNFAQYGRWFQAQNVPHVEPVEVAHISPQPGGYVLTLHTGERVRSEQVVVATGLSRYAFVPPVLRSLPPELVCHTSQIASFAAFAGLDVAVIGAGQSALEAAALLHEAQARPQLLVRDTAVHWHQRTAPDRNLWRRVRSPISKLGSGPKAWALSRFPGVVHRWPSPLRTRFVNRHLSAEGAWWLRPRVEHVVPIHLETGLTAAREVHGRVALSLRRGDGTTAQLTVDRVIAGTGYAVDVDRLEFLDESLRRHIERIGTAPKLDPSFQSSVPGLRFVGTASAMSFGPLFRFVVGADYSSRIIAGHLAARLSRAA